MKSTQSQDDLLRKQSLQVNYVIKGIHFPHLT